MEESDYRLVPGRSCGECHACCQFLVVTFPDWKKPANVLCKNWVGGCTIYNERPNICRGFFCGWRFFPNLGDEWRPDRSKILLQGGVGPDGKPSMVVNLLDTLSPQTTKMLLNLFIALHEQQYETYLSIPPPPGHEAGRLRISDEMRPAIEQRDLARALQVLNAAISFCISKIQESVAKSKSEAGTPL